MKRSREKRKKVGDGEKRYLPHRHEKKKKGVGV
jgi:hypothetical protein